MDALLGRKSKCGQRTLAPDANRRKALEDLLASQDTIIAELAKGDPEALGDLQVLFEKTRQATGSIR